MNHTEELLWIMTYAHLPSSFEPAKRGEIADAAVLELRARHETPTAPDAAVLELRARHETPTAPSEPATTEGVTL